MLVQEDSKEDLSGEEILDAMEDAETPAVGDTKRLLESFDDLLGPLGIPAEVPEFKIQITSNADLPKVKPRRLSPEQRDEVRRQVADLIELGIVRPSTSSYSSPVVQQKKKDVCCTDVHLCSRVPH